MQNEILKRVNIAQSTLSVYLNAKAIPGVNKAILLNKYFGFPYEIWGNSEKIDEFLIKNKLGLTRKTRKKLKALSQNNNEQNNKK